MAAFFVWLEFGQDPIDQRTAREMLRSIDGYGGDFKDLQISDNIAIGVNARWQTQEDVGEQQPLYDSAQRYCLLFDGRIDNRAHLFAELSQNADVDDRKESGRELSDGELLHRFLLRFGDARLAEVIGPFVFVWLDFAKGHLIACRDAMGGRYLCFLKKTNRLIIASTEEAFLAHPEVGHTLRDSKIVAWLSGRTESHHQSCLNGIEVLDPGQRLVWNRADPARITKSTFYRPPPSRRVHLEGDDAYAIEFRRLLDQAVNRRLRVRDMRRVGSMLSGGLDSAPITASAAHHDKSLIAYSWVFEESPQMDERKYSAHLCQRIGVEQRLVLCDTLWPAFDDDTHNNALFPIALPYSEFQQQTFRQAKGDGVGVLLSGLQGDLLYETSNRQVLEHFVKGDVRLALAAFLYLKRTDDLSFFQAVKRYILAPHRWLSGLVNSWRRRGKSSAPPYLTDWASKQLGAGPHWLSKESRSALRSTQYQVVLDGFAGEDAMLGRSMENKYQIERRYPFRDRDLCEFLLAIPTEQLELLGEKRPIVKRAYRAEFDTALRSRNDKTDFSDSLINGIHRDELWRDQLALTPEYWRKFVKKRDISVQNDQNMAETVVMWRCAYYNFWHRLWYDSNHKNDS